MHDIVISSEVISLALSLSLASAIVQVLYAPIILPPWERQRNLLWHLVRLKVLSLVDLRH